MLSSQGVSTLAPALEAQEEEEEDDEDDCEEEEEVVVVLGDAGDVVV